jgi:hypothetical protein
MTIDEYRNALRILLNDAVRAGLDVDDLLTVSDEELHPEFASDLYFSLRDRKP